MQHLLRVSQDRNQSPALQEINRVFGPRLESEAVLRYLNRPDGSVAQLTVQPLVVGGGRDLAHEIGHYMWRSADRVLAGVEVVCRDLLGGTDERYSVGRPASLPGPRSKPAPVQSPQSPKSSAAPSSGSASRGSVAPAKIKDAVVPPAQPPQSPR